ncbi:MAG: tetratricopeptide repeat protein, partial [Planctomycetes bacterium]|nr:tetratricopeptide repeat protein [Planctomycetota bacterium]
FAPPAAGGPPADPRHLFLDAAEALAHGRYAAAVPALDRVIAARPSHGAAQFCLAYCRQQAGQYQRALERYDAARVLLPGDPRPAYQRGLVCGITKRPAQAEAEFTSAIELAPDHAEAYRHRALARFRMATKENPKKLAEAEADLNAALERGAPALFVHLVRERMRDARGDRAGAAADRRAARDLAPRTEADFFVRGWSRMESDPEGALADLKRAAEINPRSLVALQNQAHVLADKMKDNDAALAVATKVVGLYPEFAPALAGRAVVLARLGRRDAAHKEIAKARLLSEDAEILYHAACVYAVTSKDEPADRAEAIKLLRQALREGYSDLSGLFKDPDLAPIRETKEFKEIQQSAVVLFR